MMIAACLVWYEEETASLERCVSSLSGVADVVVAVDGKWQMFPGVHTYSDPGQAAAIRQTALGAGIACRIVKAPARALVSQVAKRDYAMRLASEHGDFVLVIDGDEFVEWCDIEAFRAVLSAAPEDVCTVGIRNTGQLVFQKLRHARRRGYRSAAGVTVTQAHNGYRAADGRWLNGDSTHVPLEPAADTAGLVEVAHDRDARPRERQDRAGFYYRVRGVLGAEGWAT